MLFGKSGQRVERHSKSKKREDQELVRSGISDVERKAGHIRRMSHEFLSDWYSYLSSKAIYIDQWVNVDWWEQRVPKELSTICLIMNREGWWDSPMDLRAVCQTVWNIHTSAEKVDESPDSMRLYEMVVEFEEMVCDE
jgi:hypothetical protein